jgi:hypothetical protein
MLGTRTASRRTPAGHLQEVMQLLTYYALYSVQRLQATHLAKVLKV